MNDVGHYLSRSDGDARNVGGGDLFQGGARQGTRKVGHEGLRERVGMPLDTVELGATVLAGFGGGPVSDGICAAHRVDHRLLYQLAQHLAVEVSL